ncbi:MAG TPA: pitrilysin family protein [Pyrinomonadaceae bacterium]|jgi:zinc protease|nr:pitrilysin family protein [Pyrinomonadaceae bacterium]
MLRKFTALLFLSAAFALVASAQTKVPRLAYQERTLSNGMRVFTVQDKSSPTVAIQVWYKVGSKDDPEGRSGFAHLFEHIMFKGTKNMKDEMMDRLTEDVGGWNNASTWDDFTNYYEVVPSNYLETLLWAEADRLTGLSINEPVFKSERDVVKEEFRQRYLSQPYGMLFYLIEQRSFAKHPYRRPGIGSIEELNASTIEDVRAFHSTFYRPDNATLIVVGDFEQRQLDTWIDKYFARIPKPNSPLPRVTIKEPERTAERRFEERRPNVPLPAVAISYLAPPVSSADADALRVAESILSSGESSRLYQSLVYQQQLAQEAFANADLREDTGLFVLGAILASGKTPAEAESSLLAELKKMQTQPVTAAELDKAKNQLVTNQLRERETNNGKAFALGQAAVLIGDPARVNTALDKLQSVTAADVQRVMQKYFSDSNRVVIHYLPEAVPATKTATSTGNSGDTQKGGNNR